MVRVEGNTHITGRSPTGEERPTYELQRGPLVKTLRRDDRAVDPDFRTAWQGLCAGTVAMGKDGFRWSERAALDARHTAYSADLQDYNGAALRFTVFTEVQDGTPPQETVVKVQVSCDGERVHFYTEVDPDLRVVAAAFRGAAVLLRSS